jgi:pimeloyl-ACP methyl ester carboxylesterase
VMNPRRTQAYSATTVMALLYAILALGSASANPPSDPYEYPVEDPFLSTVVGTRAADEAPVPKRVPIRIRSLQRFPDREIPKVFWNQNELRYSVSAQEKSAPLIFVVAGTGASYGSAKMLYLQRLFYSEGFHVISLSSPTHPNFILTASTSGFPGFAPEDSEDLYAVMREAYSELASQVEIGEVHLTGYSLGGTQSAFLTAIDDREQVFHFKKILMINPSVDLFTSVKILDGLFAYALPNGAESVVDLADRLLAEVSDYVQTNGRRSVDGELLYKLAERRIADGKPPTRKGLAGLIAIAFRLSSANMFFTIDVLAHNGHIVEAETVLGVGTSLTPYFRRSMEWSFERYFDEMLLPYLQSGSSEMERDAVIERSSLRSLERLLRSDPRIAAVTNADDLILSPQNLDFLRATLGDRVKIYPSGGHCGNMTYRENVEYMVRYFKEDTP